VFKNMFSALREVDNTFRKEESRKKIRVGFQLSAARGRFKRFDMA
jgi:hypothetical protein